MEFHKGVTNIKHIEFKIGEHVNSESNEIGLDYCQLVVDGTQCNGCQFCAANDTNPHIAIDCENIQPGGSTSCSDEMDFVFGVARKLVTLQDGHTHPPTMSPTVSPAPTTFAQASDGYAGGMDADQFEGAANSAAGVIRVGATVVLASLFGFFY